MKWFRFYHEFMDDPKIAMMSDSDQLLWVKALCLASDNDKRRGHIDLSDEEICWKLRISVESWGHAIDKFRAKGMIEHVEGGYKIINWDKRQNPDYERPPIVEWRKLRTTVFMRDDYTCTYCGRRGVSLQCDHVVPVSRGGSNSISNLTTACKTCNLSKGSKTLEEWKGV